MTSCIQNRSFDLKTLHDTCGHRTAIKYVTSPLGPDRSKEIFIREQIEEFGFVSSFASRQTPFVSIALLEIAVDLWIQMLKTRMVVNNIRKEIDSPSLNHELVNLPNDG